MTLAKAASLLEWFHWTGAVYGRLTKHIWFPRIKMVDTVSRLFVRKSFANAFMCSPVTSIEHLATNIVKVFNRIRSSLSTLIGRRRLADFGHILKRVTCVLTLLDKIVRSSARLPLVSFSQLSSMAMVDFAYDGIPSFRSMIYRAACIIQLTSATNISAHRGSSVSWGRTGRSCVHCYHNIWLAHTCLTINISCFHLGCGGGIDFSN